MLQRLARSSAGSVRSVRALHQNDGEKPTIGWVGTGVMGSAMADRLLEKGYPMTIYNRSDSDRVQALAEKGAELADCPAAVASQSDIVFHMVGHPSDVEQVLLGSDGTLAGLRPGGIAVDMTTSSPDLAVRIAAAAAAKGTSSIDAPVTGRDVGARNGTLSVMLGGDDEFAVNTLTPLLLDSVAGSVTHFGGAGQGQQAKLANQVGIATQIIAMAESMVFAHSAGLDLAKWLPAVANGGMGSFSVDNYAPRVMDRNFDPGFFVTHFIKDLGLALTECDRMGITLPGLALAHQLFVSLKEQGHGEKGIHGIVLALESMNSCKMPQQSVKLVGAAAAARPAPAPAPTQAADKETRRQTINLSAGPSMLPTKVMLEAQKQFVNHDNSGMSIMEMSHRDAGGPVQNALQYATDATRDLLNVPDDYHVLFCQGGAHGQFAASIMNLVSPGGTVDVVRTGFWADRFINTEAERLCGKVNIAWSGEDTNFTTLAQASQWDWSDDSEMIHMCHNETIQGNEYHYDPILPPGAPVLSADATSTLMSRPVDIANYGLIYASAGKNLGPAGSTCVIVRDDLLGRARDECPSILNYQRQAETMPLPSLYNTPPTHNIYMTSLVLKEYVEMGGLETIERRAIARAGQIYGAIDSSNGFYRNSVAADCRSRMNVPFRIVGQDGEVNEELEAKFIAEAFEIGIEQLFAHPLFPGLRVTMYNALPDSHVAKTSEFMHQFFERYGQHTSSKNDESGFGTASAIAMYGMPLVGVAGTVGTGSTGFP